ncbi:MAG: hypothetical protein ACR2M5_15310 [Nakamurella sp.]
MDAIERAEGVLSAMRVRRPGTCLPGNAESPADRLGTLELSHEFIAECDRSAQREIQLQDLVRGTGRWEPIDSASTGTDPI